MKIEHDEAHILSGVRHGRTLGSPIALLIWNRDWKNWSEAMAVEAGGDETLKAVRVPRPGHADLPGALKYGHTDLRNVLERASARETAMRVGLSCFARKLLEELGVSVASRVLSIGPVADARGADAGARIEAAIDAARLAGDTLGGVFEVRASGLPAGLASPGLDAELGQALMSLNAIKAVHLARPGGRGGGAVALRAAMKPIATLGQPLRSVDLATRQPSWAHVERSDVCAVPAAAVVAEALAALVLAGELLRRYGGDSVAELKSRLRSGSRLRRKV